MMDRTIGRTISHFTILDRLGAGGMSVVYRRWTRNWIELSQ